MAKKSINIKEIIKSEYAVAQEDGEKVYKIIKEYLVLDEQNEVLIDFAGLEKVITAFLNPLIGNVIRDFNSGGRISFKSIDRDLISNIREVYQGAIIKFKKDEGITNG